MLSAFIDESVEFLLVGAYAMAAHGLPRATGDIDLWIRRSSENADRVMRALKVFGAPLMGLTRAELLRPDLVYQIGVAPVRIDIITGISGVEFDDAWQARLTHEFSGLEVGVIGREHLIANKRAAGRDKDLADAKWLERHRKPS